VAAAAVASAHRTCGFPGLLALAGLLGWSAPLLAEDAGPFRHYDDWFEPYEPSTVGLTQDSDDAGFLDVTVSLQLPLADWQGPLAGRNQELDIAFTGRFGFYMGDARASKPVIGKRLNPKLLWRVQLSDDAARFASCEKAGAAVFRGRRSDPCAQYMPDSYLEFAYAHESNGQFIDTEAEYQAARAAALLKDGNADYANDRLSRGWDYLGINYKAPTCAACESQRYRLSAYAMVRYFLSDGLLEGHKEEWHSWESDAAEGKARDKVNGLAVLGKYVRHVCVIDGFACEDSYFRDVKFVLGYETGYHEPFRYGTVRAEAGVRLKPLPITIWWQRGYNADLAQYYKKTTSYGIAVDIGSF